jgi:hypothetical protein
VFAFYKNQLHKYLSAGLRKRRKKERKRRKEREKEGRERKCGRKESTKKNQIFLLKVIFIYINNYKRIIDEKHRKWHPSFLMRNIKHIIVRQRYNIF